MQLDMRPLENRPCPDRELFLAVPACVVTDPLSFAGSDLITSAVRAIDSVWPTLFFKIFAGRFLIWEPLENLECADC